MLHKENLDIGKYNALADRFRPGNGSVDRMISLAKRAGAKYAVLTARHCDGFAMFDSAAGDLTSMKTSARRDFVREFVESCRRHGIRVGIYFSFMNWQFPATRVGPRQDPEGWKTMVRQTHEQVRELITNYGRIDLLWFDACMAPGIGEDMILRKLWRTKELIAMVRRLQPGILINDRAAFPEDFSTPEQHVTPPRRGRRWEACMTINRNWGYRSDDHDFKPTGELLRHLVHCAGNGGNFLLNVGPRADGSVQQEFVERLEGIGDWLRVNGEAVYGTERTPFSEAAHVIGPATVRTGRLYFHLFDWNGGSARIAGVSGRTVSAKLLGGAKIKLAKYAPGVWDVQTLPPASAVNENGLKVLRVIPTPEAKVAKAEILGGESPRGIIVSDAPILGQPADRHEPDHAAAIPAAALLAALAPGCRARLERSEDWCRGWHGRQLLVPVQDHPLECLIDVPIDGRYGISIGIISARRTSSRILLDGKVLGSARRLRFEGYPDTLSFSRLVLGKGKHLLSIRTSGGIPFGVYAFRLEQVWRLMPSELWTTIGPFPGSFAALSPVSEVEEALSTTFPPETVFDPDASYTGAGGLTLRWGWSKIRRGERAAQGVDFSSRCDIEATGICLARTVITSPAACEAALLIGCDWWANAYLNGELVRSARNPEEAAKDGAWFNAWKPIPATIRLRKGGNVLLVKCHPGSAANWFTCRINDIADLEIIPKSESSHRMTDGRIAG